MWSGLRATRGDGAAARGRASRRPRGRSAPRLRPRPNTGDILPHYLPARYGDLGPATGRRAWSASRLPGRPRCSPRWSMRRSAGGLAAFHVDVLPLHPWRTRISAAACLEPFLAGLPRRARIPGVRGMPQCRLREQPTVRGRGLRSTVAGAIDGIQPCRREPRSLGDADAGVRRGRRVPRRPPASVNAPFRPAIREMWPRRRPGRSVTVAVTKADRSVHNVRWNAGPAPSGCPDGLDMTASPRRPKTPTPTCARGRGR